MMFAALYEQLAPEFKTQARKDIGTAVRELAKALGCPDPQHCPPTQYLQPLPILYQLMTDHLRATNKSADTIRNTKNNLSRLFRKAAEKQLASLPSEQKALSPEEDPPTKEILPTRLLLKDKPQREDAPEKPQGTFLTFAHWSPTLQDDFTAFERWGLTGRAPGRQTLSKKKRQRTIDNYRIHFQGYMGYLSHEKQLTPTFDHLYDFALISEYAHWHIDVPHHNKVTTTLHNYLKNLIALTNQYQPLPELRAQLTALKKQIGKAEPVYDKDKAMVSLSGLRAIARLHYPQSKPTDIPSSNGSVHGLDHAGNACMALMLRLWTYMPYRQRNMREMQLDKNLYKDAKGKWWITFKGPELKVGKKHDREKVSLLPLPTNVVPFLEDYLTTWRPILLTNASPSEKHVFLNSYGNPYSEKGLTRLAGNTVWSYTGKHWHPHLIRTTWATEWLEGGGDIHTVSIMLGDTLETILKKYVQYREIDVAEKAYLTLEVMLSKKTTPAVSPLYT